MGTALKEIAADNGYQIHSPSRQELDIRDAKSVAKIISELEPDFVINAAAFHVVQDCETRPLEAFESNCVAVAGLAAICKKRKLGFVTYSTDYVFDGTKGAPYLEDDRPNPLQMYGISKLAGEFGTLNTYPSGSYVIRTCGVYGGENGSPSKGGNFVLNLIAEAKSKPNLEVSSEQIVNPTNAKDLAKSTLGLIGVSAKSGIYHLANEGYCSWYDFATEILANAKINTPIKPVDRSSQGVRVLRPKFTALSNQKAKEMGIVLPSWQDGLRRYIKELEDYGKI